MSGHEETDAFLLELRLKMCLESLRDLYDCQAGPPLLKDADEWNAAMSKARQCLERFAQDGKAVLD